MNTEHTPTPSIDPEMRLPEGKSCNDCGHLSHCERMYGVNPENTGCDFHPVRFINSNRSIIVELQTVNAGLVEALEAALEIEALVVASIATDREHRQEPQKFHINTNTAKLRQITGHIRNVLAAARPPTEEKTGEVERPAPKPPGKRPRTLKGWRSMVDILSLEQRNIFWPGMHKDLIPAYEMITGGDPNPAPPEMYADEQDRQNYYRAFGKRVMRALKEAGLVIDEGWSDNMDKAPRDGTWVEFCNAKRRYRGRLKYYPVNDGRDKWRTEAGNLTTIKSYTHWRLETPLPAPPEAEQEEGKNRSTSVQRWTKEQDDHVRIMWGIYSPEEIGTVMKRTADAVAQRAYHLGLEGEHKNPSRKQGAPTP